MKLLSLLITLTFLGVPLNAISEGYEQADIYRDLRTQALRVDAQLLEAHGGIFALLMETGYEEAVATIVATADGSTSMYLSNGGGTIGAGEYEQVREVVFETLSVTATFVGKFDPTDSYPPPTFGQTRFYVVTDGGVLTGAADTDLLGNEKHELSPLFLQVHKLITYIRTAEEHRRSQESE